MKIFQSKSKKFMSIVATLFVVLFGIIANGCGGGGGSSSSTTQTVEAPGVPENFQVAGAKGQGMLTLTLTWEKPLTGGAVASYGIYRSDSNVGVFDPANYYASVSADTFTFTENAGMEDNTSYWVVAARNAGGETPTDPDAYIQGSAPGGGEVEGYGNNFSAALIFADGFGITGQPLDTNLVWTREANSTLIDYNTGLRPLISQDLTVVPDGMLPYLDENTTYIKENVTYYKQQTVSTWQGQWVDGSDQEQNVTAKWGDNLGSQNNLTTNSVIRVEMGLTKAVTTPMISYNMENLYDTSGIYEMQGTDGTEYNNTNPIVYASTARLKIQKVVSLDPLELQELPTPVDQSILSGGDGPGTFGAEVTISGNLTYGYVWNFRDNGLGEGTYRITFLLDSVANNITGAANNTIIGTLDRSTTPNAGKLSDTEVYIDIDIAAQ